MDQQLLLFRRQYLQLFEPDFLAWPPRQLLRDAGVQEWLYNNLFNAEQTSYLPPDRYRFRVLKQLMKKIENAIEDPEEDVGCHFCLSTTAVLRESNSFLSTPSDPLSFPAGNLRRPDEFTLHSSLFRPPLRDNSSPAEILCHFLMSTTWSIPFSLARERRAHSDPLGTTQPDIRLQHHRLQNMGGSVTSWLLPPQQSRTRP